LGGNLPVMALTATATPKVQQDIVKNLCIESATVFQSSFNRANLYYEVRPKINAKKQLIKYIKEHKGKSGIVYCSSRKKTEEIAELLSVNDIKARPYHAGMEAKERIKNQDAFLNDDMEVIVATIAFGMGIDKPDVRFIVHYNAPKSLEGYYQETGRAGRDGMEGNCLMFYSYNDILRLEKYNKDKPITEKENAKYLIDEMSAFAESAMCRRKQLLHYFGEVYENNCDFCDNCRHPKEKYEGKRYAALVLNAVIQTEQRFKMDHIIDVLTGKESQYVKSYSHNKIEVFAKGKDENKELWGSVLRQLIIRAYLRKDIDNFGVIKITPEGTKFLKKPHSITFTKDHDFSGIDEQDEEFGRASLVTKAYDETLYEMLRGLRKKIAKERNVPPYVVFQDPSLEEMATTYPVNVEELGQVTGVGRGKVVKFGEPFIKLITRYVKENDIVTASDVVVKSAPKKSKNKIFIIQQIDKKISLDEIIKTNKMTMAELTQNIEQICFSGTKLNISYYVDQILDHEKQEEIYDYFMSSETDDIPTAIEELDDETLTEEELRLMRIKFISEMGN
ncbi:MAG: RecQ family ATP-dependent DNA helicase, partial [Bacteroidetes bacterium]|nr:RecQ family ATP-dependent DNA helicase [Bacteroidota bacterium]